jgi:hypothetical protein
LRRTATIHEAGVNILTSLLFLKKKTGREKAAEAMAGQQPDYPVFMAVAEKVGDRRGNPVSNAAQMARLFLRTSRRKKGSTSGVMIRQLSCTARSRPLTTTCPKSPRRTRHSVKNIPNRASKGDHQA